MIFSHRTGVFNESEIGDEHAANFQNKIYIKFQKIQKQKKCLNWWILDLMLKNRLIF